MINAPYHLPSLFAFCLALRCALSLLALAAKLLLKCSVRSWRRRLPIRLKVLPQSLQVNTATVVLTSNLAAAASGAPALFDGLSTVVGGMLSPSDMSASLFCSSLKSNTDIDSSHWIWLVQTLALLTTSVVSFSSSDAMVEWIGSTFGGSASAIPPDGVFDRLTPEMDAYLQLDGRPLLEI